MRCLRSGVCLLLLVLPLASCAKYLRPEGRWNPGDSKYEKDTDPYERWRDYVPAAPSSLTAYALSDSSIGLSWSDNSTTESRFAVERRQDGVGTWTQLSAALGANSTSFNDTGLLSDTTYHYRVLATNDWGSSQPSNEAPATTLVTGARPPLTLPINESFEGISIAESGWVPDARGTDAVCAYETSVGRTGTCSVSVTASTPGTLGWPGWFSYGFIQIDSSSTYDLAAWGSADGRALIWLGCDLYDRNMNYLGGISTGSMPIESTSGWQELSLALTPDDRNTFGDYAYLRINLLLSLNYDAYASFPIPAGTVTRVFFDDVTLHVR